MRFTAGSLFVSLASGSLFNYATRKSEKFVRERADGVEDTLELEHCLLFGLDVSATFTRTILVIPPAASGEDEADVPPVPGFRLVSVTCAEETHPVMSPAYAESLTVPAAVAASCEELLQEARRPESLAHVKTTSKCRPLDFSRFEAPAVAAEPGKRRQLRTSAALQALAVAQQRMDTLSDGYTLEVQETPADEDKPEMCVITKAKEANEKAFAAVLPTPAAGVSQGGAVLMCVFGGELQPFHVDALIFSAPLVEETCQAVSDRIDPKLMCFTAVDSLATATDQEDDEEDARCQLNSGSVTISFFKEEDTWNLAMFVAPNFILNFSDNRRTSFTTVGSVDRSLMSAAEEEAQRLVRHLNENKDKFAHLAGFTARPGTFLGDEVQNSKIQFSPECLALRIHGYSRLSVLKYII